MEQTLNSQAKTTWATLGVTFWILSVKSRQLLVDMNRSNYTLHSCSAPLHYKVVGVPSYSSYQYIHVFITQCIRDHLMCSTSTHLRDQFQYPLAINIMLPKSLYKNNILLSSLTSIPSKNLGHTGTLQLARD